jgi:hypothetical protein
LAVCTSQITSTCAPQALLPAASIVIFLSALNFLAVFARDFSSEWILSNRSVLVVRCGRQLAFSWSFQFASQGLALLFISAQGADFHWRSVFTVWFHLPVARVCDSQSVFAQDRLGSRLLVASPVRDLSASVLCCWEEHACLCRFFHFLCDSVFSRWTGLAIDLSDQKSQVFLDLFLFLWVFPSFSRSFFVFVSVS